MCCFDLQVAIKFWPRDPKAITKDVQGELRSVAQFCHPHIIGFKRVILTPTHLGLVMEYAAGGDLFKRIKSSKGIQVIPAVIAPSPLICHGSEYVC